jgi:hypothetical protein
MGFKHGTALLVSDDLPSPISWGLMRPVILLNRRVLDLHDQAEAIIAHELAHITRLDWAKLLLARLATALYWFNPFVWMLAREAHQLREETADDAVLAANIADTDYAELLVGAARHQCRGLLLTAHGVAPSRHSLSRRIRRVLDTGSVRGPAARGFAAGVAVGVLGVAAPLAALSVNGPPAPTDGAEYRTLPSAVVKTVSVATRRSADMIHTAFKPQASPSGPVTASATAIDSSLQHDRSRWLPPAVPAPPAPPAPPAVPDRFNLRSADGAEISMDGAGITMRSADGATLNLRSGNAVDRSIAMKALGVTSEYAAAMRAATGESMDSRRLMQLRGAGVTPEFVREMRRAGLDELTTGDLIKARSLGVTGAYISDLAASGYPDLDLDQIVRMRALGVTPAFIRQLNKAGYRHRSPDELIRMKMFGFDPNAPPGEDSGPDG